ncbi:MAG: hypothetical protein J0H44_15490 [Alphaproteobacteria bacterium]|nr:hypothetical protein [Alphaproteobacteria bacterium]
MAIDLFCHSSLDKADVEKAVRLLSSQHADLFSYKFLISKIRDSSDVNKEIALEFGFHSKFLFLIRVNDHDASPRIREVAGLVMKVFGPQNVLVLFENETEVGPEHQSS